MSLGKKLSAARSLINAFERWPDDSHKVYASFKAAQIALYSQKDVGALPVAETLELRAHAARSLEQNVNEKAFPLNPRMLRPDGNEQYYEVIMREANRQAKKSGLVETFRRVVLNR